MQKTFYARMLVASLTVISLSGCAGRFARNEQEEQQDQAKRPQSALQTPAASSDISTPAAATDASAPAENPRATSIGMNARLDAMEAKLSAMNDKLDATRASLDNFLSAHQPKATGAPTAASDSVGIPVASAPVATDSESGYVNDQAIQQYRRPKSCSNHRSMPKRFSCSRIFSSTIRIMRWPAPLSSTSARLISNRNNGRRRSRNFKKS